MATDTISLKTDIEMRRAQRLVIQADKLLTCDGRALKRLTRPAKLALIAAAPAPDDIARGAP